MHEKNIENEYECEHIKPLSEDLLDEIRTFAGFFSTLDDMEDVLAQDGIKIDDRLREYLAELAAIVPLEDDEEKRLVKLAADGDEEAKARLIEGSLRLAVACARIHADEGLPLIDLIQEGSLGLVMAADSYSPADGMSFNEFAAMWIEHAIASALGEHEKAKKMPVKIAEKIHTVTESRMRLTKKLGREATDEEIAADTGLSEENVRDITEISLDLVKDDRNTDGDSEDSDDESLMENYSVIAELPQINENGENRYS